MGSAWEVGRGWARAGAQSQGREAWRWAKRAGARAVWPFIPLPLAPSPVGSPPPTVPSLISGTPASASLPFLLLLCQLGFLGGVLVLDEFHPLLAQRGLEVPVLVWRQRRNGRCTGSDPRLCSLALPFPLDGSVSSALLWGPCILLESWFPLLFTKYSRPACQPLSGASPPPLPCSPLSCASTAIPGGGKGFRGGDVSSCWCRNQPRAPNTQVPLSDSPLPPSRGNQVRQPCPPVLLLILLPFPAELHGEQRGGSKVGCEPGASEDRLPNWCWPSALLPAYPSPHPILTQSPASRDSSSSLYTGSSFARCRRISEATRGLLDNCRSRRSVSTAWMAWNTQPGV